MTYIKKLIMQGFKSFPQKTEIVFDKGINVILGPNGSGKSNISDALCFVLGRLSIKSIRAAKAKNLLFMGTKNIKPAKEAHVEIIFDNSNKTFAIPENEISIKRIVRHNGQGIYKINNKTKTRAEVIETLAHAGIDPYGFNIILQGQIHSLIKMHSEERRKIIEEVAGISIYESRKEKSLKELEKTDVRLKEISTILRERTIFLRNLEKEKKEAFRYKELEKTIKRCKASILNKKITFKEAELNSIKESIQSKTSQKNKTKTKIDELQEKIESFNNKINQINKHIQKSTGFEQESLHEDITNLKAELEGSRVRKENYENKKLEIENRIEQMGSSVPEYEAEIQELTKKSPLIARKQEELKKKKTELEKIEEERKKIYSLKTELNSLKERLKEKENQLSKIKAESDATIKQIEEYSSILNYSDYIVCQKAINELKKNISSTKINLDNLNNNELENTRLISSAETQVNDAEKIKGNIENLNVCPLCQNKMTAQHVEHVNQDCDKKIQNAKRIVDVTGAELEKIVQERKKLIQEVQKAEKRIIESEKELVNHRLIQEKQDYVKKLFMQESFLKKETEELQTKRENIEKRTLDSAIIEEQYNSKLREIEEISSRTEEDLDTTLLYKERDLERIKEVIKLSKKDLEEVELEIENISESIYYKTEILEGKEEEERKLTEKFKNMLNERDSLQEKIQKENYNLSTIQNAWHQIEEQINYLKIGNAKLDAEKQASEMELKEFAGMELIKASLNVLEEKLIKSQESIQKIGLINLRALEVYEDIKIEYEKVQEKVDTLEKEKLDIFKIIEEIDRKKKRTFMKTFKGINELFTRNFSRLSTKGQAFLEIQNKEDIFSNGVDIVIKMAKGKYFDVTSLSGGEQSLVAISLLFAIQEHKPYHFYIFDEIDAALDKRNSERLSALLKKYTQTGQYLIITHNDAIIVDSDILYGVSMHDGVSKILSLRV
ncbi:MAG: chromosome segregation protein SMC [Nanoarchaeota archaeon]|nr:chromosome segregation protein SMC [Nanoarchaeota archaeon]